MWSIGSPSFLHECIVAAWSAAFFHLLKRTYNIIVAVVLREIQVQCRPREKGAGNVFTNGGGETV